MDLWVTDSSTEEDDPTPPPPPPPPPRKRKSEKQRASRIEPTAPKIGTYNFDDLKILCLSFRVRLEISETKKKILERKILELPLRQFFENRDPFWNPKTGFTLELICK